MPHAGQTGYFGWYQRFVSRQQLPATAATNTLAPPASNVLTVSFKHSAQKGTIPAPQDAIFTKTVYLRSHQSARLPAAVFYFGAAQGRACAVTGNYPCPGEAINTSVVGVGNASCVLRCNASQPGTETLLLTVCLSVQVVSSSFIVLLHFHHLCFHLHYRYHSQGHLYWR